MIKEVNIASRQSADDRLPLPAYRFEFKPHELDAIFDCHEAHGFAIVKQMISREQVAELKESVRQSLDPNCDLGPGETRLQRRFVEVSQPTLHLLEHEPLMAIYRRLLGTSVMTVHRSAAILKNAGCPAGAWHTDRSNVTGPPRHSNDILNRGDWPNGMWFYLEGTHPSRGGLAVIEDSHRADWRGPKGFDFTEHRGSFHRRGTPAVAYDGMDVPGIVPLYTDPGDLIIFAGRTYHGVFPHNGSEARHSVGFVLRPGDGPFPVPWELSEGTRRFLDSLPAHLSQYFKHYTSMDRA